MGNFDSLCLVRAHFEGVGDCLSHGLTPKRKAAEMKVSGVFDKEQLRGPSADVD